MSKWYIEYKETGNRTQTTYIEAENEKEAVQLVYDKFGGYRFDVWHDDEDNDEFVGTFDIDDIKIEEPVNDYTDDELEDMERYYGLLDDDYDEMRENGVSWSDFI